MPKRIGLYELSVIVFFALLPMAGVIIDSYLVKSNVSTSNLMFKWFVFSGVGLRLLTAGFKQAIQPSFTAREIFKVNEEGSFRIVKEIGLANMSFGTIGILSFLLPEFRLASAVAGGLYFGLAGYLHLSSKKKNKEEIFAMVSDYFIFFVLLVLAAINFGNTGVGQ